MKTVRTVVFWIHLVTGVTAGLVILIMSVTGVALTYEKPRLERARTPCLDGAGPWDLEQPRAA